MIRIPDMMSNQESSGGDHIYTLTEVRKEQFPFPISFSIMVTTMGDRFHVVAMDELGREARYGALDWSGFLVSPVINLPLSHISGIAAGKGRLIVAGAHIEDKRVVVMGIGSGGSLLWEADIPVEGTLARWPLLVSGVNQTLLVWETGTNQSTLWVSEVLARHCSPGIPFKFDDNTDQLDVVSGSQGILLARTHGIPTAMELIRLDGDHIAERVRVDDSTAPKAPSLALLGKRCALLWISQWDCQLRVQEFNEDFTPVSPQHTLVSVSGKTRLHSARFLQDEQPYSAINYRTLTVGDNCKVINGDAPTHPRCEPKHTFEQFIGILHWKQNKIHVFHRIVPPTVDYDAGCWLGSKLLLIHGQNTPVISIYQGKKT